MRLTVEHAEGSLQLTIEDSGTGVAPDQADKVFLPFFTTKATGSGVGLSLSRQIAQAHGGTLALLPFDPGDPDRLGGARFRMALSL